MTNPLTAKVESSAIIRVTANGLREIECTVVERTEDYTTILYKKPRSPLKYKETFSNSDIIGLERPEDKDAVLYVMGTYTAFESKVKSYTVSAGIISVVFMNDKTGTFKSSQSTIVGEVSAKRSPDTTEPQDDDILGSADWKS